MKYLCPLCWGMQPPPHPSSAFSQRFLPERPSLALTPSRVLGGDILADVWMRGTKSWESARGCQPGPLLALLASCLQPHPALQHQPVQGLPLEGEWEWEWGTRQCWDALEEERRDGEAGAEQIPGDPRRCWLLLGCSEPGAQLAADSAPSAPGRGLEALGIPGMLPAAPRAGMETERERWAATSSWRTAAMAPQIPGIPRYRGSAGEGVGGERGGAGEGAPDEESGNGRQTGKLIGDD